MRRPRVIMRRRARATRNASSSFGPEAARTSVSGKRRRRSRVPRRMRARTRANAVEPKRSGAPRSSRRRRGIGVAAVAYDRLASLAQDRGAVQEALALRAKAVGALATPTQIAEASLDPAVAYELAGVMHNYATLFCEVGDTSAATKTLDQTHRVYAASCPTPQSRTSAGHGVPGGGRFCCCSSAPRRTGLHGQIALHLCRVAPDAHERAFFVLQSQQPRSIYGVTI